MKKKNLITTLQFPLPDSACNVRTVVWDRTSFFKMLTKQTTFYVEVSLNGQFPNLHSLRLS